MIEEFSLGWNIITYGRKYLNNVLIVKNLEIEWELIQKADEL